MGAAFGLQCLSGFIIALWPADGGRYPAEAHQAAMAAGLGLQLNAHSALGSPGCRHVFLALQGLWAAPWLADVAGFDRPAVVEHLTLMATALAASALLLGAVAERLRRAGIPTELFLAAMLALSMAAQLALLLGLPVLAACCLPSRLSAGAATVLSFAVLAQYFPKEVSGRANAALGVLNMGTAFGLRSASRASSSPCGRPTEAATRPRPTKPPWPPASVCN